MKSIIVSGNPNYGLGSSLYKKFPDAKFCSRSSGGYDFFNNDDMERFAEETKDFDVYISCSCLYHFQQTLLLGKVWKKWNEIKKKGQIIVFGSTADWGVKVWMYPTEKKTLKDFCRRFGGAASGGGPNLFPGNGIRITYVAPGMLDLPKQREKYSPDLAKLDTDYLCGVVDWLINQPENINIYEISMDPVQHEVDKQE